MFVEQLASMYEEIAGPVGIPWDGLIAKGHGLTENGYDPAYMDLLLQESFQFFGVIGGLSAEFREKYRYIRTNEARRAITQLTALINQTGADVWNAIKKGDFDAAVNFPRSMSVDAFAAIAASAANGAFLHFDGVMENAMRSGHLTPEEVQTHAESVMRVFQTFVSLNQEGHFDQFKPGGEKLAGLGVAPLVVAAWAALGITVVIGLCYALYIWRIASPIQNKVFEWCDKLANSKNASAEDVRSCISAATSMQEKGNGSLGNFLGDAIRPIAIVAGVGVALYIGSLFLPAMLARRATA